MHSNQRVGREGLASGSGSPSNDVRAAAHLCCVLGLWISLSRCSFSRPLFSGSWRRWFGCGELGWEVLLLGSLLTLLILESPALNMSQHLWNVEPPHHTVPAPPLVEDEGTAPLITLGLRTHKVSELTGECWYAPDIQTSDQILSPSLDPYPGKKQHHVLLSSLHTPWCSPLQSNWFHVSRTLPDLGNMSIVLPIPTLRNMGFFQWHFLIGHNNKAFLKHKP